MPSQQTQDRALKALDNMRTIAKNEMLARGDYVTDDVQDEKLAKSGAICGGRKACAIGSVYIGAGVKPIVAFGDRYLPGTVEGDRTEFLRRRPHLRLAIGALNEAAERMAQRRDLDLAEFHPFVDAIEGLFENHVDVPFHEDGENSQSTGKVTQTDFLRVINSARRAVAAGTATPRPLDA